MMHPSLLSSSSSSSGLSPRRGCFLIVLILTLTIFASLQTIPLTTIATSISHRRMARQILATVDIGVDEPITPTPPERTPLPSNDQGILTPLAPPPQRPLPSSPTNLSNSFFLFPRPAPRSPTASFFITAAPNHGAGLGHQFGEWIFGPWLAMKLGLTYVHTGFLINSARWTKFLGFGEGEHTPQWLFDTFGNVTVLSRTLDEEKLLPGTTWIPSQITRIRNEVAKPKETNPLTVTHQPHHSARADLSPDVPFPVLFSYEIVHVPTQSYSCDPVLHRLLRQKYCAARIKNPVEEDLYLDDRQSNRIVVALHLRCGDSCFDSYRATAFDSIVKTTNLMSWTLREAEPNREVSFHIFSQPPHNTTAESHFAPLLKQLSNFRVTTHFATSSTTTLHHLVKSDVLLGSQSSFSWIGSLFHNVISMGPIPNCNFEVPYDKWKGDFNTTIFLKQYEASKGYTPKFNSWQDCEDIANEPWHQSTATTTKPKETAYLYRTSKH